jgi:hypothetical protein
LSQVQVSELHRVHWITQKLYTVIAQPLSTVNQI